jgi:hypothetical protein
MAKVLIHFINVNLTPMPITVPDQITGDEHQLRDYLRAQIIETIGKKSAIRCIWFLSDCEELRAYYPTTSSVECRTYNCDELILASLDPSYASLRATGRMLQMLEESNIEPLPNRLNRANELHLISPTE